MAKVYLDTNIVIDIFGRKTRNIPNESLDIFYTSTLSYHILFYTSKFKTPNILLLQSCQIVTPVDFTDKILTISLQGPTGDLEDNIQLHSAIASGCDLFITSDKRLLKMGYFGKVKISSEI